MRERAQVLIKAAMRSADVGRLAEQIERLERAGIDALHFDVLDGRFAPEVWMAPSMVRGLREYTTLPFEIHLLVVDPTDYVEDYVRAGANCLVFHVETIPEPGPLLERIHRQGCQAGLALKPSTDAGCVEPYLSLCDTVNVMTVTPGVPGVLQEDGVRLLSEVAAMVHRRGGTTLVQADGAVSLATRQRFLEAGAQALIAGYPIFSCADFGQAIAQLRHGHVAASVQQT